MLPRVVHVKITIDGTILLDDQLGPWENNGANKIRQLLAPAAKQSDPGTIALLVTLGHYITTGRNLNTELTHAPNGFTLTATEQEN
jgi:hypothetical protein